MASKKLRTNLLKLMGAAVFIGALIFLSNSPASTKVRDAVIMGLKPLMQLVGFTDGALAVLPTGETSGFKTLSFEVERLRAENGRLKRALDFRNASKLSISGAEVLLRLREFGREYIIINSGKDEGIKEGDWVVNSEGVLVGTIFEVGQDFSKTLIASNPDVLLKTEVIPGGVPSVSRGLGARSLSIELISEDTPVRKGDFVVATGDNPAVDGTGSRFYFLLGQIVDTETKAGSLLKEARAVLLAEPQNLDEVFVVRR